MVKVRQGKWETGHHWTRGTQSHWDPLRSYGECGSEAVPELMGRGGYIQLHFSWLKAYPWVLPLSMSREAQVWVLSETPKLSSLRYHERPGAERKNQVLKTCTHAKLVLWQWVKWGEYPRTGGEAHDGIRLSFTPAITIYAPSWDGLVQSFPISLAHCSLLEN